MGSRVAGAAHRAPFFKKTALKTVYIALGSNLGDRVENLLLARERIVSPHVRLTRASSIYETAPREVLDQPWFLNQVVAADTTLFPRQLLARLLRIEQEMGRRRTMDKGPRVIDLDILLFGDVIIHAAGLEIPHPRMAERRFVLEPLAELAPGLRPARSRHTISELLAHVMDQPMRRL